MSYEIGSTQGGMTDLADLTVPVEYPTGKKYYQPYAKYIKLGDGSRKGLGLPKTKWVWPQITQEERDQLETFFTTGSDTVYISTRLPDDSFADFMCIGNWPEEEPAWVGGYFQNFEIEFTQMEALGGGGS